MKVRSLILGGLLFGLHSLGLSAQSSIEISGELRRWHRITLTFTGEEIAEKSTPNPFLDHRLNVTFSKGDRRITVPGYFAADGNAAESSAAQGTKWRAHFSPDETGTWNYEVSFRKGRAIAVSLDPEAGEPAAFDGGRGQFTVTDSDKSGRDFRARGRLQYTGERYLHFAATGAPFLKGGADSPENFLGYRDFDGTYYGGNQQHRSGESAPNLGLHAYEPHIRDWKVGDPSWQNGKGKGMIGALNYLAGKGMNSVYFLTMNVQGDGDDVWPWTDRNERYRFDCSKLDQWEIVFSHMDRLGLMLHIVLQETENEAILDGGYLDVQRKLYLREMVARFAHHLAITWNLGEEHGPTNWSPSGQTPEQTMDMAAYLRVMDPYDHFIAVHTHSYEPVRDEYISRFLGFEAIEGPSIQVANIYNTHEETLQWLEWSRDSAQQWVVCLDEIGPAHKGALPDSYSPQHDTIRKAVLWSNLMAGGGGVEWYFGYRYPHNDLNCEDWRSRDNLWNITRYALQFFQQHLPFPEMESRDELTSSRADYCLAKEGEVYVVYLPDGGTTNLDLREEEGTFTVYWYNPRRGGALRKGTVKSVTGGGVVNFGLPPEDVGEDWAVLIRR